MSDAADIVLSPPPFTVLDDLDEVINTWADSVALREEYNHFRWENGFGEYARWDLLPAGIYATRAAEVQDQVFSLTPIGPQQNTYCNPIREVLLPYLRSMLAVAATLPDKLRATRPSPRKRRKHKRRS